MVDEHTQMTARQVRFDMSKLVQIAVDAVGSKACVSVKKCLMECTINTSGVQLGQIRDHMNVADKVQLLLKLSVIQAAWLSISLREFGAQLPLQGLRREDAKRVPVHDRPSEKGSQRSFSDTDRTRSAYLLIKLHRANSFRVSQSLRLPGAESDIINKTTSPANSDASCARLLSTSSCKKVRCNRILSQRPRRPSS